MLHTSILDRLSGPLCDAVCPDGAGDLPGGPAPDPAPTASGQATLEYLARANLLVVPLDDRREWFRYHQLFADVLQARLLQERPHHVPDLHRRASAWYERNGMHAESIRHALAAGDYERTADLIELARPAMERGRQSATWLGWTAALPDALLRTRPALGAGRAAALLDGAAVEPLSDRELEVLALLRSKLTGPEIAGELRVSLNTVRTHTQRIYSKLGVHSRMAAVRRAEELGLL